MQTVQKVMTIEISNVLNVVYLFTWEVMVLGVQVLW